jgi:hypothetical protein
VQASSLDDMAAGGFLSPDGSAVSARKKRGRRQYPMRRRGGVGAKLLIGGVGGGGGAYQRKSGGEERGGAGGRGLLGFGNRRRACKYIGVGVARVSLARGVGPDGPNRGLSFPLSIEVLS